MSSGSVRLKKAGVCSAALFASTMLTSVAYAQSNQGNTALEEVVVTAQKRSENLQDVPVSIQALGGEKLEQLQVSAFVDYVKYLPSVSFTTSGPGFGQVYMRGVASGGDGNHSGSLPSVGVYLDEQPVTTIQGALDIHVYDVARVEALAGPQGTLYGASSQAGTLRIITNKPTTVGFAAGVDAEVNQVDHGGMGHTLEGFVNIPLSDKIAVRAVGWDVRDAGYIDNVAGTRTYTRGDDDPTNDYTINNKARVRKDYNRVYTQGGRAALRVELNENWVITPSVMGQVQKSGGLFAFDPKVGDLKVTHFYPESAKDKWVQAAMTIEGQIANLDVTYAGSYLKRNDETNQDYTDYSYFYDQVGYGFYWTDDNGNLVNPSQYIQGRDRYRKESHEIRIASPQDQKFRFVVGGFYQKQKHGIFQNYRIDGIGNSISVENYPGTIWLTAQERIDRDKAVFGQAEYDITDKLMLTAGIRFFKAHNTLVGFFGYGSGYSSSNGVASCFKGPVVSGAPCTNLDKGVKESGNSPKVTLTYKLDSDKLVYATYSKGFRPGGINRRSTLPPYHADYLKNYEAGWKTSWGGAFRWNGAVFMEDWSGFQFSILGANGLTEIKNANQARIKGIESDITWAPAHGFTLNASAAYTDAKLSANYCGATDDSGNPITDCAKPQAPDGTRLPITPKFKANLTARYEYNIGAYDGFWQVALMGQTSNWTDLRLKEREIIGKQGRYSVVDFSTGVSREGWSVQAYLKNVFDKRASLNRYAECAEAVCGTQAYIVPNQPRTVGLKVGKEF
ncbi:TonB-dependent receptor [Caulobacter sp. RL271]|jgi:outer membrane receptor protein involved in Fe transport|uniref:TonB-dependent receptor n=1 Tax=Caulobacter segnis TaxID=88688 RepID=A0ABY4ZYL3_9CAUL|nr:TonB-dependent receptor [Caulobacter segnis]USQ97011.1 TonB-dependent receptor [Caulobacter segnis]